MIYWWYLFLIIILSSTPILFSSAPTISISIASIDPIYAQYSYMSCIGEYTGPANTALAICFTESMSIVATIWTYNSIPPWLAILSPLVACPAIIAGFEFFAMVFISETVVAMELILLYNLVYCLTSTALYCSTCAYSIIRCSGLQAASYYDDCSCC